MTVEYLGRKNVVKMKNSKYINIPAGVFDHIEFFDVFFDKTKNALVIVPANIPKTPFEPDSVGVGGKEKKEAEVQQQ